MARDLLQMPTDKPESPNPVTPLHTLIVPKRHAPTFFDLSEPEARAAEELIRRLRDEILDTDAAVQGFNIGINVGEAAGQTIFHCRSASTAS